MTSNKKLLYSILLLVALVLVNITATHLRGRLDFTHDKIYTLSEATRSLLEDIKGPLALNYYYTSDAENVPIDIKNFAERVLTLLREYENNAGGHIKINIIDPQPDSKAGDDAIKSGLSEYTMPSSGQNIFFGLLAEQADRKGVVPVFDPSREQFLEYDISHLIHAVTVSKPPRIGVLTSLDVFERKIPGTFDRTEETKAAWAFMQEMQALYDVVRISGEEILNEIDALVIIHPQRVSLEMQFAIDQFLLSGNPVLIAVDPSSIYQRRNAKSTYPTQEGFSSNLPMLFKGWGFKYDPQEVVGDLKLAAKFTSPGGKTSLNPTWLDLHNLDDHPVLRQLENIVFPEAGAIKLNLQGLDADILLKSSRESSMMMGSIIPASSSRQLLNQVIPDRQSRVLGAILHGSFSTAFPDGSPSQNPDTKWLRDLNNDDGGLIKKSVKESTLILLTDTDFIADFSSVRHAYFMGQKTVRPINDNLALFSNLIELMTGKHDLMAIRGRGNSIRPFTVLENIRADVAKLKGDKRNVRKEQRDRIEKLNTKLVIFNLLTIPLFLSYIGVSFFYNRMKR